MTKLYIIGLSILIIAIIANGFAIKVGLKSWYDFINLLNEESAGAFKLISVLDYLWLSIVYPVILGLGYLLGNKLYEFLFKV